MSQPPAVIVIGYGSDLRGDDAVGRVVAEALAAEQIPDVLVFAVHQLTPELAEPLAAAERAIFLDASAAADASIAALPLTPGAQVVQGHTADPAALLGLAAALYGRAPRAWLIPLPAERFDIGAPLSARARAGATAALALARRLIAAP